MWRQSDFFPRLTAYLAQVVGLCNLFLFFSSTEANGYQSVRMLPWLLLSTALFSLLHRFKNSRPLGQIALMAATGFVVTGLVMSLFFVQLHHPSAHLVAWGFFAITTIQCCIAQYKSSTIHGLLLCCELHALGVILLLWFSEGGVFYLPLDALVLTLGVILLNLLALISARVGGCGPHSSSWDSQQSVATTATLLLVLLQGGLALLVVRFAIGVATATVTGVTTASRWVGNGLLTLITQFFTWLSSLLPSPELQSEAIYEAQEIISVEAMEEMEGLDPRILILLAIIAGAIALCVALWMLYKFRHWRLPSLSIDQEQDAALTRTGNLSLLAKLKGIFFAQWTKIQFFWAVLTHRNTPQGAVILLSRMGASRGLGRQSRESYHSYLTRLALLCQEKNPAVSQSLRTLSASLDSALYQPDRQQKNPLTPKEYSQMLHSIARLPRQK